MDERVAKLESLAEKTAERLATLDRDIAVIKSNYATGKDVVEAKNSIILWVVGAVVIWGSTVVGASFFIAKNIH